MDEDVCQGVTGLIQESWQVTLPLTQTPGEIQQQSQRLKVSASRASSRHGDPAMGRRDAVTLTVTE